MPSFAETEQHLVRRLARQSGRTVKGGRAVRTTQDGLLPLLTWLPGQEPLPVCEYPTTDAAGHDRECRRIATHVSLYPGLPGTARDFCAYHALESAANGEIFEPEDWLMELGIRALAARRGG
jgi:hypothetical protein